MFRFYNPYTYEHLYTTDVKEAADLRSRGWNAEGIGWYSPIKDTPGVVKIYRLYNPYGDDHLYTTEVKEKDDCIKRGWKLDATFEAYGFISKQLGAGTGISRLFNPYEKYHTHLFSANKKELEDNIKRGWRDEQVRWYVPGKPAETTPAAIDTDVHVSTGSGSGSSHVDTTPKEKEKPAPKPVTPTLSEDQKTILAAIQKPAEDLVEATRTNILKGGKTPEEAIQALQTKADEAKANAENLKKQANVAGASDEVKKQAATAALVKEEADFLLKYAKHVKAYNEATAAKNAAQKKFDDLSKQANQNSQSQTQANSNTKASNANAAAFVLPKTILMLAMASTPSANTPAADQTNPLEQAKKALEEAKKHETEALNQVLADENEIFPLTYTVHFINDRQGRTGNSCTFKDRQVTIYTCIAKQEYAFDTNIQGAPRLSCYTEAKAVDCSLAHNDESYNHLESTDKYPYSRVRYDKEHNWYTVEFVEYQGPTKEQAEARWASRWKTHTVKADPNNKTGLPELNMSIMGLDTKLFHATDSDDINTLTQTIAAMKGACPPNGICTPKFKPWQTEAGRKARIAGEFYDTEGRSQAVGEFSAHEDDEMWKEAAKHSEYKLPDAITSTAEPNVDLQIKVYELKKAELEYNEAKKSGDANAQLKARINAINAAMQIMHPLSDVIYHNYTDDTYDLIYVRYSLLSTMLYILTEQVPADTANSTTKANYQKYVNAFVTWMNDQTDANKEALKAAEIAYRGKSRSWELKDVAVSYFE